MRARLLGLLLCAACAEGTPPPDLGDHSAPPIAPPPPIAASPCARAPQDPAPVRGAPLEALVALLGRAYDDPALAATTLDLGALLESEDQARRPARAYLRAGVMLSGLPRPGGAPLVTQLTLTTRADGFTPYAGRLPVGLDPDHTRADVARLLGSPDAPCDASVVCRYRARGLAVRFEGACLAAVEVFAPVDDGHLRLELITATPGESAGSGGLQLAFVPRLGLPDGHHVLYRVELRDVRGRAVGERRYPGPVGEGDPTTALESLRPSVFVPYHRLQLPPGTNTLRATVHATDYGPRYTAGQRPPPAELRPQGTVTTTVTLVMPLLERARVGLAEVAVEPGTYDDIQRNLVLGVIGTGGAGILAAPFIDHRRLSRPDLTWSAWVGGELVHRAPVRADTWRARWSTPSASVTLAVGDRVTLCVEDEDLGPLGGTDHESLGCIEGTLDQLDAWAQSGRAAMESDPQLDPRVQALRVLRPR